LLVGFSAIYNRIDVIIITKLLDYKQTGLYTAAYKFFDIMNFFPASVSHVLFPVLAGLMAKNLIFDVKATLEKYLKLMVAAALPMAVGGTLLSKQLMQLLAGKEPRGRGYSVCFECKLAGNPCRLLEKKICLGPITAGGCGAICVSGGSPCYGCFGLKEGAQIDNLLNTLYRFSDSENVERYFSMFLKKTPEYARLFKDSNGKNAKH